MSIADKILRLFRTKQELKRAISERGVTVVKEDKLSAYPVRLEQALGDVPFCKCDSVNDDSWSGNEFFAIPGKFWLGTGSGLLRNYWLFVSPGRVYSEDAMVEIEEMSRGSAASSDAPVQDPVPDDQGGSSSPGLFEAKLSSLMSVKDGIRSIGRAFGIDFGELFSDYPMKIGEIPLPSREFYRCVDWDPISHTWSGIHAEKRSDGYAFSDAVTEGLKFYGDVMLSGTVYSGDGMLAVKDIYEVKEINYLESVSDIDLGVRTVPDYVGEQPVEERPTCLPFSVRTELKGMRNGDSILFFDSSEIGQVPHFDSYSYNAVYSAFFNGDDGLLHFGSTGRRRWILPYGQTDVNMVLYPRIFSNGKLMEGSYMNQSVSIHFGFSSRIPSLRFKSGRYDPVHEEKSQSPVDGGKIRADMDTYSYDIRKNINFYNFLEGDGFESRVFRFEDDLGNELFSGTAAISGDALTYSPSEQEIGKKHIELSATVRKKGWPECSSSDFMHIVLEVVHCPQFRFDKDSDSVSGAVGSTLFYSPSFRIAYPDGNSYGEVITCSKLGTVEGKRIAFKSDEVISGDSVTLTGWLEDENGRQVGRKDTLFLSVFFRAPSRIKLGIVGGNADCGSLGGYYDAVGSGGDPNDPNSYSYNLENSGICLSFDNGFPYLMAGAMNRFNGSSECKGVGDIMGCLGRSTFTYTGGGDPEFEGAVFSVIATDMTSY